MKKFHIKKGDTVYVNAGNDKGKTGRVLEMITDKDRAIVEGVNMVSKHTKPNPKHPQGGIIKQEAAIHVSNLQLVDPVKGGPTRIGRKFVERGDQIMAKTKKNTAEAAVTAAVPAGYVPTLKKVYKDEIVPKLMKEFSYTTVMQVPKLVKITINQGIGDATGDKKLVETAQQELTAIAGQKAVATHSRKDISNFKLRKGMPIGVKVTLRATKMYEFLERLIRISLPRIRDFNGISEKMDGKGNYTLGIKEQIIFPEIDIDKISKILGMEITFVTTARTDEEAHALLREFGLPFKKHNN